MLKALCLWLVAASYWLSVSAQAEARLAIIIDDIGYNKIQSERAARLNGKFTLAVLPFTPYGLSSAHIAHKQGKELMLHLPMSAINHQVLGKGALVSGMEKTAFLATVRQDLSSIPYIKGVNNHMGSRLTQEAEPMQWLMAELHLQGLYFIDSRTTAQTKAFDIAKSQQVESLKRDVFLDDNNEHHAIEEELIRAIKLAHARGAAVAIGHPYTNTLDVLETIEPLLQKQGVRLVYASQLLSPIVKLTSSKSTPNALKNENSPFCTAPPAPLLFDFKTNIDLYGNTGNMLK